MFYNVFLYLLIFTHRFIRLFHIFRCYIYISIYFELMKYKAWICELKGFLFILNFFKISWSKIHKMVN